MPFVGIREWSWVYWYGRINRCVFTQKVLYPVTCAIGIWY